MKNLLFLTCLLLLVYSCNTTKKPITSNTEKDNITTNDTLRISGNNLEYDIIIVESGFNLWLASRAQPEGYYTLSYLENRNIQYVSEWNRRVLSPGKFNDNLYELQIDYKQGTEYGYDVNYKLFNYFVFFQNKYKQNLLGEFVPLN